MCAAQKHCNVFKVRLRGCTQLSSSAHNFTIRTSAKFSILASLKLIILLPAAMDMIFEDCFKHCPLSLTHIILLLHVLTPPRVCITEHVVPRYLKRVHGWYKVGDGVVLVVAFSLVVAVLLVIVAVVVVAAIVVEADMRGALTFRYTSSSPPAATCSLPVPTQGARVRVRVKVRARVRVGARVRVRVYGKFSLRPILL